MGICDLETKGELIDCPFCGTANVSCREDQAVHVVCNGCYASGPPAHDDEHPDFPATIAAACERWNRRHLPKLSALDQAKQSFMAAINEASDEALRTGNGKLADSLEDLKLATLQSYVAIRRPEIGR